jgi:hypothetical protein
VACSLITKTPKATCFVANSISSRPQRCLPVPLRAMQREPAPTGDCNLRKAPTDIPSFLKSTLPVCLPVLGSTRRATQRESALAGNCNLREARTWRSVGLHLFSFLFLFCFVFLSQSSCHLQIKTPNASNGYLVVKSDRVMSYQVVAARGLWRRRRRWQWS